jgi:putative DNA primase/helicase
VRKHSGAAAVTSFAAHLFQADGFEQELDKHAHLLGVANGVVDLRTGQLRARRPEDYIHRVLETAYDPGADTRLIAQTVLSAMADSPEMADYLQRLLGYGITGETSEEVFAIFIGSGRNCKGVLTQALAELLGPFYVSMNAGVVCDRQVSNLDAERGKLLGARLAVYDELRPGERLKTHEVQLLSGGDGIPARPLYKDPLTIRPRHLNILSTNYMPELTEVIPAIVERLIAVPFPVTYTDLLPDEAPSLHRRQKDTALKRRLSDNKAGTLTWLVQGAVAWYSTRDLRRGAPDPVRETTSSYLDEQDRLAAFLRERCETGDPGDADYRVSSAALREAYGEYVRESGAGERVTDKTFAASMRAKGFDRKLSRLPGGANPMSCYLGLRLLDSAPHLDDLEP